jgi:predicted small integral membrane protein
MHFETQVERILMQLGRFFGAIVVLLAVVSAAEAHDFPTNTLATGLVRITPSRIDLLIRVPLDVLHAIPFR